LEDFESTLTKPASFEESGIEIPFVILGDEAYLLKMYLMKPFARKDLSFDTSHIKGYSYTNMVPSLVVMIH
jgi:hypothetical protein